MFGGDDAAGRTRWTVYTATLLLPRPFASGKPRLFPAEIGLAFTKDTPHSDTDRARIGGFPVSPL